MHDLTTQTDSEAAPPDEEIKNGLMGTAQAQEVAIEQAHRRFAKPLAAFIRERVAPTFDSDEIATAVSDTFCAVARYAALGKLRASGSLSTLFFKIARRKAIDILRKKTCHKRQGKSDDGSPNFAQMSGPDNLEYDEDEFECRVTQHLILAPEIQALWTAAGQAHANEIIRQFRLWIGCQPRLQRKVAEIMLTHFGSASDAEICKDLRAARIQCTPASVKSARRELVRKFKSLLQQKGIENHDS